LLRQHQQRLHPLLTF